MRTSVKVQPGQTLWSLALQYYGNGADWPKIYAANPQLRPDPNLIVPPQTIVIPPLVTPPPPSSNVPVTPIVVLGIAGALASVALPTLAAAAIAKLLNLKSKIQRRALELALELVERFPQPKMDGFGAAQREIVRINDMRRAAFIPAAMKRIEADLNAGLPVEQIIAKEQRYFAQHFAAADQRMRVANRIDALQWQYGNVLGWYAKRDGKTTAECKSANGKNFSALAPPRIGWPGIVHVNCRCEAGKPHRGARMLP